MLARRDFGLVALAVCAGLADATSFMGFGGVFVGNMSGNVILLGVSVNSASGVEALRPAVALVAFAIGILLAARRVAADGAAGNGPRYPAEGTLWVVALLQSAAALGWLATAGDPNQVMRLALIGGAAVALGVQSTLVARLALPGVSTTFMTGTMIAIGTYIRGARGSREINWVRIGAFLGLLAGAAAGAGMLAIWRPGAMLLPAAGSWLVAAATRGGADLWGHGAAAARAA